MVLAAVICMITRRVFGRLMPYFRRDLPREVAADIVKHSWCSFTSSFWEVICNYDAKKDADALGDLPVLCVHGDQDETAPLLGALVLAAGRPSWQVHILNGVDHQPWLRAPEICQMDVDTGSTSRTMIGNYRTSPHMVLFEDKSMESA
jgi:pimeloyl-ACP methyl ester carboxylesterase